MFIYRFSSLKTHSQESLNGKPQASVLSQLLVWLNTQSPAACR
jgi:hypothetical protein